MIRVNSIFQSISGEVGGFPQGSRAAFLRLGGCNLRCPYCDTPETQTSFKSDNYDIYEVYEKLLRYNLVNIVITGGEPLLQKDAVTTLCHLLVDAGKQISIETNGTLPVPDHILNMAGVYIVMDWKLRNIYQDGFKRDAHNKYDIFNQLRSIDYVKFVVKDETEINLAIGIQRILQHDHGVQAKFAYSPVILQDIKRFSDISFTSAILDFARNILKVLDKEEIDAILNLQLHKFLGID